MRYTLKHTLPEAVFDGIKCNRGRAIPDRLAQVDLSDVRSLLHRRKYF